jgi:hypothetical protein
VRRLFSTRYGFFALAAVISWALLSVIETEHRWVALGLGSLYALLSVLFFLEELSTRRPPDRRG